MRSIVYFLFLVSFTVSGQELAVLQYGGGGDWYSNPTALPNLIRFCNEQIRTTLYARPQVVRPNDQALFDYPMIHMTGHGNVYFTEEEASTLRDYLLSGGFLHIDDNYGMDQYLRRELSKVFPDKELKELPASHPIFQGPFPFPNGLPKIHEHDQGRPQAFGISHQGRLVLLYTYESDLGDGWEDPEVHNDPMDVRLKALQMGANIVHYAFGN